MGFLRAVLETRSNRVGGHGFRHDVVDVGVQFVKNEHGLIIEKGRRPHS